MGDDNNILTIKVDITKGEIIEPTESEKVDPQVLEKFPKDTKYVALIVQSKSSPYCIWINMGGWWIRRCFPPLP